VAFGALLEDSGEGCDNIKEGLLEEFQKGLRGEEGWEG
jgi:hypothetical protein